MLCPMVSTGICFGNFYVDLGCSAPQVNGRFIFVIQGKALWEQCAMPPAVPGTIHLASYNLAKSGTSPNLDRDKMFNELWWLHSSFCKEIDIGDVGIPCFGGEAENIWCHGWCGMTMVGDPPAPAFVIAFALTRCLVNFGGRTTASAWAVALAMLAIQPLEEKP